MGDQLKAIYRPKGEALEYARYGLNLYGGCSHGCRYCYNQYRFRGSCNHPLKKATLENIRADLETLTGSRERVHLCFVGDPYDRGREDNSYTRKVLELFREYNHPFQVLTKGGTKAVSDFDLYGPNDRFGVTLTFFHEDDSKMWEPGAALTVDRIVALGEAHECGIPTWASLEPVIYPEHTLALIKATHDM
jgi:DNA repair photolyase